MVVIDTMRAVFDGEENDSGEVARALNPLSRVAHETGAAILMTHHEGKNPDGGASRGFRGSSAIGAIAEALCRLTARADGETLQLTCGKMRVAALPEPLYFRISEGPSITWLDRAPLSSTDEQILEDVAAHSLTSTDEIAERTGVDLKTVRNRVTDLYKKQVLDRKKVGKAWLYKLPTDDPSDPTPQGGVGSGIVQNGSEESEQEQAGRDEATENDVTEGSDEIDFVHSWDDDQASVDDLKIPEDAQCDFRDPERSYDDFDDQSRLPGMYGEEDE